LLVVVARPRPVGSAGAEFERAEFPLDERAPLEGVVLLFAE
jgi:hypothetical protein